LFCAWLAWSRFRVVLALWDRTMPSVVMALDRALRAFGGAPTYALTDNEKTVSIDQVCGIAVRNRQIVSVGRHYGLTIATCVPADPESKGGSEATVRIAKADLVPTDHNLRPSYRSFAELENACEAFCERVNAREHRITRRAPAVMLVEEQGRLHRLPAMPHTLAFGQTRRVSWQSTISVGGALSSVPSTLVDERVWARVDGSELVVVHADGAEGPREVARHALTTPGSPSIRDEHDPPRPAGAIERRPRARSTDEQAFLQIGPAAEAWLVAAAAAGTTRHRRKVAEAVALAKIHGNEAVDDALRAAADAGRFGDGDLAAILMDRPRGEPGDLRTVRHRQEPPCRSARPPGHRPGQDGGLAHPREPGRAAQTSSRRRHRRQSHRTPHQGRSDRHRRHRGCSPPRPTPPKRCSASSTPPPKTLAAATVDRLLHHPHVLLTDGTDSYRLAQATAGKGVTPLT
jgi:hypothetical protein